MDLLTYYNTNMLEGCPYTFYTPHTCLHVRGPGTLQLVVLWPGPAAPVGYTHERPLHRLAKLLPGTCRCHFIIAWTCLPYLPSKLLLYGPSISRFSCCSITARSVCRGRPCAFVCSLICARCTSADSTDRGLF